MGNDSSERQQNRKKKMGQVLTFYQKMNFWRLMNLHLNFHLWIRIIKSSHQWCSVKKGVHRNFAKFTGKHLCQSLLFNKVAGGSCNFIKKETLTQVFSCEFCENSKNTFFTEHLRTTASQLWQNLSSHLLTCQMI